MHLQCSAPTVAPKLLNGELRQCLHDVEWIVFYWPPVMHAQTCTHVWWYEMHTHILHQLTYPFTFQHMEDKYKHPLPTKHMLLWHSFSVCTLSSHNVITWYVVFTCSELKMAKSHANTSVFWFTANSPRTQVIPSRGRRMTDAFTIVLEEEKVCK